MGAAALMKDLAVAAGFQQNGKKPWPVGLVFGKVLKTGHKATTMSVCGRCFQRHGSVLSSNLPIREKAIYLARIFGLVLLVFTGICFLMYLLCATKSSSSSADGWKATTLHPKTNAPNRKNNLLIVTAHPDDECMFFGPTIRWHLNSPRNEVFLVCLSIGNYYGVGETRKKEFLVSCDILGIKRQNIRLLDHKDLQDEKYKSWNRTLIANIVKGYVEEMNIDQIITFDERGLSDHPAHISVHYGVRQLLKRSDAPKDLTAYKLVTGSNAVRQHSWLLDLPFSYFNCDLIYVVWWRDILTAQRAFWANRSQFGVGRLIWIFLSPYMIYNPLKEIHVYRPDELTAASSSS